MNPISQTEKEIFFQAVEITDPIERENFLQNACSSDPDLKKSVDALLADHDQATRLFQDVLTGFSLESDPAFDADIGSLIGPYRLIAKLGEGGSGVVYEADQQSPVHRKVAMKILKAGMDKQRVMNRFEAERQALELMEHPNIARVLDAGLTPDQRPFFVMELVRGVKITEYCSHNALPLPRRLELMLQVCSAVQHAHQKGVIHRDLKPSNILVTESEGVCIPKVIDFGIAKAMAGASAQWTLQGPIGTPAYMSPEQLSGSKDIDTRADIYSLGVILYELLAGAAPMDRDDADTSASPLPPSQIIPKTASPPALWNEDLDWIVLKAMDKDRDRRYETVRGLSQDIGRYLAHEPIHARPPSRIYRFKKLIRRNRLASAAIAAGVLALCGGFTVSTLLYLRAKSAERLHALAEQKQSQLRAEAEERECVTRAAILLMQNKTADADAEIQRMGGMLSQPSVEATTVFRQLATWNAARGDWKSAARRLLALSRVNRFDDSDMTENATRDLVPLAPALIEAGEINAYRDVESLILDRLEHTNNPIAAEHILKICLLLPPSNDLLKRLAPAAAVAEESLPNPRIVPINWLESWRGFALGLWYYRVGEYDASIFWLTVSLNGRNNETVTHACSLTVRNMALKKTDQPEAAAADLDQAKSLINAHFAGPQGLNNQGAWNDWLYARILLREAQNDQAPVSLHEQTL